MTFPYGKNVLPLTVGFDRLLSTFEEVDRVLGNAKPPSFPPYDIIKVDHNNYEVHIAVAGFPPENIDIEINQNKLIVSGTINKNDSEINYLHRGLGKRDFKHVYTLSDTSVVKSADIKNGILNINIENVLPEAQKPRKIPITIEKNLLTKDK